MTGYDVLKSEIERRVCSLGFRVESGSYPIDGDDGEISITLKMKPSIDKLLINIPAHEKMIHLKDLSKNVEHL